MKPPFAYYGGKTMIADRIVSVLPDHRHYVEPFAGSLAVLLAKPRADHETVNDISEDLITFWRVLREQPDNLATACALTPHSRAEHRDAYNLAVTDELERARRVWVMLSQGRAGTMRRTGWRFYRAPAKTSPTSIPDYLEAYVQRIPAVARRLHGVSLECRPALELITEYGQDPETLIYADPPYLRETRRGTNYSHEMADPAQHHQLAEALRAARAAVVLSGYDSPQYAELYEGWTRVEIAAFTGQGLNYGQRTEVLWINRPPANPSLFDPVEAL